VSAASPATSEHPDLARWQQIAMVAGIIGCAMCLVGLAIPDTRVLVFRALLVAFCFHVGLAVGSMVIVMLQYLTGGEWGFVLRRPLEAATRTLPLVTLFYLPIAFGLPYLYEWAHAESHASGEIISNKYRYYLNPAATLLRAVVYFAIWNGLVYLLNRWSRLQDQKKEQGWVISCETLSAPGLVLYVLTITFASIDWAMSLEPHWFSTIYGAMFGMGQVLSAFACAIAVLLLVSNRPPLDQLSPQSLRDLGSLLLAFVMVWAYLSFSQFLLIWSGNLPEEVPWYEARLKGGWQFAGLALVIFHFALPFVLLLSTDIKRDRKRLASVALLVLFMRVVDLVWLIVPAFGHSKLHSDYAALAPVFYVAGLVGLGGLWLGYYLWQLRTWPLLPEYKPAVEGATHGAQTSH
jgi:hypothetical protein